jgi:hypothetical protein
VRRSWTDLNILGIVYSPLITGMNSAYFARCGFAIFPSFL